MALIKKFRIKKFKEKKEILKLDKNIPILVYCSAVIINGIFFIITGPVHLPV